MNFSNLCFFFHILCLINSVFCEDFKCPVRGKVGGLKVPNVLSLIDKQTGYQTSVEVINPNHKRLISEYNDLQNSVSFIDFESTNRDEMDRIYYYHSKAEKLDIYQKGCTMYDLSRNEKIDSVRLWFEPSAIVADSEIFKDLDYLGPTGLMIYANKISDKASFIGSEVFEGRSVNHWFYCTADKGPYIDFYFDVKTSLPYRFSLYYPKWIETQEVISENQTSTVKSQVDSEEKYVYNFFKFKPLIISAADPIPYPLGYGCVSKGASPSTPLPDFSKVKEFTMDMEAVITYSDRDPIKSTARVMKRGDIISYEIQEETDFVRSIEMPPPLGRYQVDENTGQCRYYTSNYSPDVTLVTRWPFHEDRGFNLLNYLVMKPTKYHEPTFISNNHLGPIIVQEYRVAKFFSNSVDAFVDYYYTNNVSTSVPSKVVFTIDRSKSYHAHENTPTQVDVTIINYEDEYIDYEDRFDVSGCYEEPGTFTWFQLFFSNPWTSEYDLQSIKEQTEEYLTSFIPITRIGPIHTQQVDSNIYVTVKLFDRVHFIEAYKRSNQYTISSPSNIVKRSKVEDCEQLCSSNSNCNDFSYCDDHDCSIFADYYDYARKTYKTGCTFYTRSIAEVTPFINKNYLSTMAHVLQQIRDKVSSGQFRLSISFITAEDLFIVNGPEEIGDISQEVQKSGSSRPLRSEDFSIIKTDRHFNEAQFKFEKSSLNDCFMACLNDDDCNTLSYCINGNKECTLSAETSKTIEDKTSHADGCNIYEKSFINLFHNYPGKTLVLDAISTLSDLSLGDCAKTCAQSSSFNCESFDYCQEYHQRNTSLCFLHVNHIEIDRTHEINISNWKSAETGCSHYSKKSELDYEHKVGFALKDTMKDSIVATFDHLSLENCASKCNLDPNCFTLEFCEAIDYDKTSDSSFSLSSCSLTNLKPSKTDLTALFEKESKGDKSICSIYINRMKIAGKSQVDPHSSDEQKSSTPTASNNFNLAFGLSTVVFILAFAGGFIGFKFALNRQIVSV